MNKGLIAALVAVIVIVLAGGLYWTTHHGEPAHNGMEGNPDAAAEQPGQPSSADQSTDQTSQTTDKSAQSKPEQSPAELFCGRDLSDVASRTSDAVTLAQAGGVVQIFQHEAALKDPYGCADFYLKHGLDIDAVDPRPDSEHLTPLLFAIKRNDPKMVHFMLDHDADLQQRGGPNQIKPYGYAVFLALKNQSTNYNQVIGILDSALQKQPANKETGNTQPAKKAS